MNLAKINDPNINVNGTSLRGYVETTYDFLKDKLGKPMHETGDKVTCTWEIEFIDKSVATIYDWKTEETPMGKYHWHIGGHFPSSIEKVQDLLGIPTSKH